jgi:glucose/arabinose dehydrogenase
MRPLPSRFIVVLLVLLTACGTGGGTESTSAPAANTPMPVVNTPLPSQTTSAPTSTAVLIHIPTATLPAPTAAPTNAGALPNPAAYSWQPVIGGLDRPLGLVNAGDGSGRLFIVQQGGLIRILKDGALLTTPFLDLSQKVVCCGERGLLGLAFHPQYTQNGYFYVDYTESVSGDLYTVIARYQVSTNDPNQADPNSELRLLHIQQPYPNHNGGQLQFGTDGYLYIGMGDGGSQGDPNGNGQSPQTLLGKILRIDVDGGEPYVIPADNPFSSGGGLPEIWDYGFRNPWRFSFDRLTGDLYIGDVGQNSWEEIDFLPAGSPGGYNFGWNYYEGTHSYQGTPPAGVNFVMPVAEYGHDQGESVTGGYVYRGANLPEWQGVYLYGDYGSGLVWGLLRMPDGSWQNELLFQTGAQITSFGVDESGEIYLVDYSGNILILK